MFGLSDVFDRVFVHQFSCGGHDWFKSHLRKHTSGKAKEKEEKLSTSPNIPDRRRCCPHCDFTYARSAALGEHARDLILHMFPNKTFCHFEPGIPNQNSHSIQGWSRYRKYVSAIQYRDSSDTFKVSLSIFSTQDT